MEKFFSPKTVVFVIISFIALTAAIFLPDFLISSLPEKFTAWGTSMLAGATVLLILHNEKIEKRRRIDEKLHEERERKERLLNEIKDWATNFNSKTFTPTRDFFNLNIEKPTEILKLTSVQRGILEAEAINIEYFNIAATQFDSELGKTINALSSLIDERIAQFKSLELKLEASIVSTNKKFQLHGEDVLFLAQDVTVIRDKVNSMLDNVMKEVAKAKIALLIQ